VVHVYIADARTPFQAALDAGGTEVQALREDGDGDLRGGFADGNGVIWWMAQQGG